MSEVATIIDFAIKIAGLCGLGVILAYAMRLAKEWGELNTTVKKGFEQNHRDHEAMIVSLREHGNRLNHLEKISSESSQVCKLQHPETWRKLKKN